jgi:hypothetical protein
MALSRGPGNEPRTLPEPDCPSRPSRFGAGGLLVGLRPGRATATVAPVAGSARARSSQAHLPVWSVAFPVCAVFTALHGLLVRLGAVLDSDASASGLRQARSQRPQVYAPARITPHLPVLGHAFRVAGVMA